MINIDTRIQNRHVCINAIVVNAIDIKGRVLARKNAGNAFGYALGYGLLREVLLD